MTLLSKIKYLSATALLLIILANVGKSAEWFGKAIIDIEIISGLSEKDEVVYAPYNVITKRLKDCVSLKVLEVRELTSL